jgi:hypothetical protein
VTVIEQNIQLKLFEIKVADRDSSFLPMFMSFMLSKSMTAGPGRFAVLRCMSSTARLLGSRIRIPWGMDIRLLCLHVVLSCVGRGLCDGLIAPSEEPCLCIIVCD